jgi:cell division protein FtsQ
VSTTVRRRRAPSLLGGRRWRPRLRLRWRPRLYAAIVVVALILAGGWLWLRQSSLVAIRQVTVVGVSGADAGRVRAALIRSARTMTTLDVSVGPLRRAVAGFDEVKQISVSTHFPHGVVIDVGENIPVALITVGGRQVAVAGDGQLLPHHGHIGRLPTVALRAGPVGNRVRERAALNELAVLGSAPYQFLPRISAAITQAAHGVVVELRNGPSIYFGPATQLAAKWQAVVSVLADGGSDGALYIDVTIPNRPAAGGGNAAAAIAAQQQSATSTTATDSTLTTATATATGAATTTAPVETTTDSTGTTTGSDGSSTLTGATATAPAGTATDPGATGSTTTP